MCKARKDHVGCPMLGSCDSCVNPCGFTPEEIKAVDRNETINTDLLEACKIACKALQAKSDLTDAGWKKLLAAIAAATA